MTTTFHAAAPKLRSAVVAVSFYFAACWMLLADEHAYWGAFFVLLVALVVGAGVLRSLGLLRRNGQPASRRQSQAAPQISIQAAVDVHSADPEDPQHQRARFLGALGHELRNPLNSVTGFSDMLLGRVDGELNTEQERSVRTIRSSAERLLRLVSTVVDRAKLEAGTLRLQQQWVAPDELISEAISFVRSRVEDTSVIGGGSEDLPRIFVDRHRTVHSLVSLAVLVIRSSGTEGFVQFDLMATLENSSADTLALVERLEKPLSRSDALGLEVAVARNVIEAQGGRIWTEAGTAGSFRVCMTLPTSAR
jgi:signal transduction histidine kinase